jgi:hypothetical protein
MAGNRPFGVSLLTVIAVFYGAYAVAIGILALVAGGTSTIVGAAAGTIFIGLIYLLVARGLWRGSSFARLIVTIVTVLSLTAGVLVLIAADGTTAKTAGAVQALVALVVLALLFNAKAKAFFK